jgi:hypothetical protein
MSYLHKTGEAEGFLHQPLFQYSIFRGNGSLDEAHWHVS